MKSLTILGLLVFFVTKVFAGGSFVRINGEKFCKAGSGWLAYKYLYDWKEGGYGYEDLNLRGMVVHDFKSNKSAEYELVKENPVKRLGALYERITPSDNLYRYIVVYAYRDGGAITHTNEFNNNRPVSPIIDEVYYLLRASYQPWEHCN